MACNDYPNLWEKSASFAQRRGQLAAARAQLAADTFAPFSVGLWLKSTVEYQLAYGCLRWPAPKFEDPAVAPGATFRAVPVLVLDGDLDSVTPLGDSQAAAHARASSMGARTFQVRSAPCVVGRLGFRSAIRDGT